MADWGVNLRNLYGITEHTLVLCQSEPFQEPGDAGVPLYPKDVRLAPDGEILVRGPGMFAGYWKNEAATSDVVRDGWFHTGDVAEVMPNGHFRIVDRKKDIMVTAGGKNIAPSEIENLLKASPFVSEAVLFADGRKFPSVLIEIDYGCRLGSPAWRHLHRVTPLAQHSRVIELIGREIEQANAQLARVEQVKSSASFRKELDPEEGDTTPTRKVRRRHTYALFKNLVEDNVPGRCGIPDRNRNVGKRQSAEACISLTTGGNDMKNGSRCTACPLRWPLPPARRGKSRNCPEFLRYRLHHRPFRTAGRFLDTPTWEGFDLYIKALNDRGGIGGRKVEVTLDDDGLKADRAVAAAKKQVERDNVIGIFGLSLKHSGSGIRGNAQGRRSGRHHLQRHSRCAAAGKAVFIFDGCRVRGRG